MPTPFDTVIDFVPTVAPSPLRVQQNRLNAQNKSSLQFMFSYVRLSVLSGDFLFSTTITTITKNDKHQPFNGKSAQRLEGVERGQDAGNTKLNYTVMKFAERNVEGAQDENWRYNSCISWTVQPVE